jgi:hypothetical protein
MKLMSNSRFVFSSVHKIFNIYCSLSLMNEVTFCLVKDLLDLRISFVRVVKELVDPLS